MTNLDHREDWLQFQIFFHSEVTGTDYILPRPVTSTYQPRLEVAMVTTVLTFAKYPPIKFQDICIYESCGTSSV